MSQACSAVINDIIINEKYKICYELGRGSFGVVYVAVDIYTGQVNRLNCHTYSKKICRFYYFYS